MVPAELIDSSINPLENQLAILHIPKETDEVVDVAWTSKPFCTSVLILFHLLPLSGFDVHVGPQLELAGIRRTAELIGTGYRGSRRKYTLPGRRRNWQLERGR